MVRIILIAMSLAAAMACTTKAPRDPCDHLFGATVEFQTRPDGLLESARFAEVVDCNGQPIEIDIPQWWKQGACGALASWGEPTYAGGEPPATRWTYFAFDTTEPNAIRPMGENSRDNPVYHVDESILGMPASADRLGVCTSDL